MPSSAPWAPRAPRRAGGAALAGFYFGHRTTEVLDFFSPPGPLLAEAAGALHQASAALGATVEPAITSPDFQRFIVHRGTESCVVDLVIDRAPTVDQLKPTRSGIRIDTLREMAANKRCTVLGRAELKDLVDLKMLLDFGIEHGRARRRRAQGRRRRPGDAGVAAARPRDRSEAALPGGLDPRELDTFRRELATRLETLAFDRARRRASDYEAAKGAVKRGASLDARRGQRPRSCERQELALSTTLEHFPEGASRKTRNALQPASTGRACNRHCPRS